MFRMYGEPAEVWLADGRPVQFAWRGRLYVVRQVLQFWLASPPWWKRPGDTVEEQAAASADERQFWRLEAACDGWSGIYELRLDTRDGRWLLARMWG